MQDRRGDRRCRSRNNGLRWSRCVCDQWSRCLGGRWRRRGAAGSPGSPVGRACVRGKQGNVHGGSFPNTTRLRSWPECIIAPHVRVNHERFVKCLAHKEKGAAQRAAPGLKQPGLVWGRRHRSRRHFAGGAHFARGRRRTTRSSRRRTTRPSGGRRRTTRSSSARRRTTRSSSGRRRTTGGGYARGRRTPRRRTTRRRPSRRRSSGLGHCR